MYSAASRPQKGQGSNSGFGVLSFVFMDSYQSVTREKVMTFPGLIWPCKKGWV